MCSGRQPCRRVCGISRTPHQRPQPCLRSSPLCVAHAHALGLPPAVREHPKPQALILEKLADDAWDAELQVMIARRMTPLLGERVFPMQAEVAMARMRIVLASAVLAVALTSLKVLCNGMPTTRRFGTGADVCRFRCCARGGDDARHYLFCLVLWELFLERSSWRRPGWFVGGDMRSLMYCLPLDATTSVAPAV